MDLEEFATNTNKKFDMITYNFFLRDLFKELILKVLLKIKGLIQIL